MNLIHIRKKYKIPARVGQRVEYAGPELQFKATIMGATENYLVIHIDGMRWWTLLLPTKELRYL